MSQPRGEHKSGSDGGEGQRKAARVGIQESVKKEQCQQQAKTVIREKIGVRPRGDSSCSRSTDTDRERTTLSCPKKESENFDGQVKEAQCEVGVR